MSELANCSAVVHVGLLTEYGNLSLYTVLLMLYRVHEWERD